MTDTEHTVVQPSVAGGYVRTFYEAVAAKDTETIASVIEASFARDVAMIWPASLPYGGVVTGAAKLSRMFASIAASAVPAGADNLRVVDIVDGGDQVAAHVEFDWYAPGSTTPISSRALELWTFSCGQFTEVRAFYWDTAELLGKENS